MAIQKYGMTDFYGYGFTGHYNSPETYYFHSIVKVIDKSLTGNDIIVEPRCLGISLRVGQKDYEGRPASTRQPLYVIFDGEAWREYFSGTVFRVIDEKSINNHHFLYSGCYDIDRDNDLGLREVVIGKIKIMEAKDFANIISKYSDKQINSMVQQMYTLINNAKLWGINLDRIIQDIVNRRNNINASSATKLESNYGKYANVSANSERNYSGYQTQQGGRSTYQSTKGKSGCLGLLMLFLLPIISLITIAGVYLL